ncbi:MAG: Dyp-type peroxidase [Sphingomonas sp.]
MALVDAGDIQAIVDRGFGSLAGATHLLLRVIEPRAARAWLRSLPVTSLEQAKGSKLERVCQLAFTAPGLEALGFDPGEIGGFAPEFLDGMAGNERKSAQLGDIGANAPSNWEWGLGPNEPHVLIIVLAPLADISGLEADYIAAAMNAGLELVRAGRTNGIIGNEPFGFADGLSQPEPDWDGKVVPGRAADRAYRNSIAAGEFLLGHPNEYGFIADYPAAREVGRNGTYLVYRQLAQDVRGLWRWLAARAGPDGAARLAELMVGRGVNGDPLAALKPGPKNEFGFDADPDGICCPVGAHIRRANPRSGDDPLGDRGFVRNLVSSLALEGSAIHDAVASARFHRILRRGRGYGPVIDPSDAMAGEGPPGEEESGLHFICLGASLARQFEFVQGAWISSPYFAGQSCEQDPMLGNRLPDNGARATDNFSYVDDEGCPRLIGGLPQFVTVRGGAYFFLPGLDGLGLILEEQER